MGSAFVVDTYNGAALFRSTAVEIYYMCVFLVTPILMFAIFLMAQVDEPWRYAAGTWAILVSITFCLWGLAVTVREVQACFWLVEKYFFSKEEATVEESTTSKEESQDSRVWKEFKRLMKIADRALLLTQTARYSGEKKQRYHVLAGSAVSSSLGHEPLETSMGLYSRIVSLKPFTKILKMFETIEPKRVYSSEEVRDILPFGEYHIFFVRNNHCAFRISKQNLILTHCFLFKVTKNNWSMQKMVS